MDTPPIVELAHLLDLGKCRAHQMNSLNLYMYGMCKKAGILKQMKRGHTMVSGFSITRMSRYTSNMFIRVFKV